MKACWPGASLEDFLCFRVTDTFPAMSNKLNAQAKPRPSQSHCQGALASGFRTDQGQTQQSKQLQSSAKWGHEGTQCRLPNSESNPILQLKACLGSAIVDPASEANEARFKWRSPRKSMVLITSIESLYPQTSLPASFPRSTNQLIQFIHRASRANVIHIVLCITRLLFHSSQSDLL